MPRISGRHTGEVDSADEELITEAETAWRMGRAEAAERGAITQARQRLGTEAVKEVFSQIARPAATELTPGA